MSVARDLPHDVALPHLAQALDADAMGAVFAGVLTNPGMTLERCMIERIKYRPQRNCTLSYRLQLRDVRTGLNHEQRVAARLCSGGASLERATRARPHAAQPSLAGPALHHFPALDMVTWWWPNDAKLIAPAVLSDDNLLRQQVLPEVVAALSAGCGTLTAHHIEIAQYVPEHRLCARVDLQWHANGKAVSQRIYAKTSREPDGATAHGYLRAFCSRVRPGVRVGFVRRVPCCGSRNLTCTGNRGCPASPCWTCRLRPWRASRRRWVRNSRPCTAVRWLQRAKSRRKSCGRALPR